MLSTDLIKGLEVVSTLLPGQTLNVAPLQIVNANRLSSLQRRWRGEGRQKTVAYLKELIKLAIDSLPLQMNLYEKVKHAMEGLHSLKVTYQDDALILSDLDELISQITSTLAQFDTWIHLNLDGTPKVLDGLRPVTTNFLESPHIHQTPVSIGLTPNKTPCKTPEIHSPTEMLPTLDNWPYTTATPPSSPRPSTPIHRPRPSIPIPSVPQPSSPESTPSTSFFSTVITPFSLMRIHGPFPKPPTLPFLPLSSTFSAREKKSSVSKVQMEDVD